MGTAQSDKALEDDPRLKYIWLVTRGLLLSGAAWNERGRLRLGSCEMTPRAMPSRTKDW